MVVSHTPRMEIAVSTSITCRVHQNLAVAVRSMAGKLRLMELRSDRARLKRLAAAILANIVGSDAKAGLAVLLRHRRAYRPHRRQHKPRLQLVRMGHAASPTSFSVKDQSLVLAALLLAIVEVISTIAPIF